MNVFISYARVDRDRAQQLAAALEGCGWSVWWDPKIRAGQSFDDVIERELQSAECVVVLWSTQSITSEWVKNEASEALARGVLIPARIDDVKPPLEFRRRQTADLVGWNADPMHAGFRALRDAVAAMVAGPATPSPAGDGARPSSTPARRSALVVGGIALAAVLLAIGYGTVSRTGPADQGRGGPSNDLPPVRPSAHAGTSTAPAPASEAVAAGPAGKFEFGWPGQECWQILRADVVAKSGCGSGTHALQPGTYRVQPSSTAVFVPFSVSVASGATTRSDAMGGLLRFDWPGNDCWKAHRGDVVALSSCGSGTHALQEGVYVLKPSSSAVFEPITIRVQRGQTTRAP